MSTPAMRYKQQCERAAEAERLRRAFAAGELKTFESMAEDTAKYNLLLDGLNADRKRISDKPQGAERLPLKRGACAAYTPYVKNYIESGKEYRNEVLVQVMIWRFDLGEINAAVDLAKVAIEQRQPMPERFNSTLVIFVADAVLEWSTAQRKTGGAVTPYFEFVFDNLDAWALHDIQKAKYCKFAAETAFAESDFNKADEFCARALGYDPKCAIKTMRGNIDKELARIAETRRYDLQRNTENDGSVPDDEKPEQSPSVVRTTPAGGGGSVPLRDSLKESDEGDVRPPPAALSKTKTAKAAKSSKAKPTKKETTQRVVPAKAKK